MKKALFVVGTRPEAIKMAPLIKKFQADKDFTTLVCSTGQHKELLDQILSFFEIKPDFEFNVMTYNQTLTSLTATVLQKCEELFAQQHFDFVFVQGDTTSAYAVGLAAFYKKMPVVHIEAGLRTFNKMSPFPEELNRVMLSQLASIHFCPTEANLQNLHREHISEGVYMVGNTVIDALYLGLEILRNNANLINNEIFKDIDFDKRIILLTSHRRENFGSPFKELCEAVNELAQENPDIQFVYPVHPNPNILLNAQKYLTNNNIFLITPLDYKELIYIMEKSFFIMTDSGGIQEEAPSLKKPVMVLRQHTERMEGVANGNAKLVGTNKALIKETASKLLTDPEYYNRFLANKNPYGEGDAATKILNRIRQYEV